METATQFASIVGPSAVCVLFLLVKLRAASSGCKLPSFRSILSGFLLLMGCITMLSVLIIFVACSWYHVFAELIATAQPTIDADMVVATASVRDRLLAPWALCGFVAAIILFGGAAIARYAGSNDCS